MNIKYLIGVFIFSILIGCNQKKESETKSPAETNRSLIDTIENKDILIAADTNKIYDYILFGIYCGECGSHCATMYQYNMKGNINTLFADYTDSYFEHHGNIICSTPIHDTDNIHLARSIVEKIPAVLLSTSEKRFGCPDCTDGCGIYFEFAQQGKIKKFAIDTETSKLSPGIKTFSEFLKQVIGQMKNNW